MKSSFKNLNVKHLKLRGLALAAVLMTLSACNMNAQNNPMEGIGFRQERFAEIAAMREYRQCRDEGVALDARARSSGSAGQYLASARLLEKCEANLGPEAANVATDERIRAYALSIQNYVKGGELKKAKQNLGRLKEAFPGKDLYFTSGESFIDSISSLLEWQQPRETSNLTILNVSELLKSEMRRVRYWKHN